jgi:hypothetical protein
MRFLKAHLIDKHYNGFRNRLKIELFCSNRTRSRLIFYLIVALYNQNNDVDPIKLTQDIQ